MRKGVKGQLITLHKFSHKHDTIFFVFRLQQVLLSNFSENVVN
jgi:hypothetical protein